MSRVVPLLMGLWFAAPARAADTVLYVVRHAEKATEPKGDPPLTPEGQARAVALAGLLADVPLVGVHSTDRIRTRTTAQPTATAKGLEIQLYPGADFAALLGRIRAVGGSHLVVGHSDTIAPLVVAAGGDGGPTVTDTEFDRLYVVVLPASGTPTTVRLRYGAAR